MAEQKRIYLCLAHMSGREQDFIKEAFDSNWVVPLGPNVDGFERDLEEFVSGGAKNTNGDERRVVALSSGTAAIHLALVDAGVGPGDEVICQSFTFSASANPICYVGATPVFVDSEPDTWNMSPALLEKAIEDRIRTTGKKPKAIILVYLYGMPAKIDEISEIAHRYNITLIEDAAEAFGSLYSGQSVGVFGDYGVLSFNGNKMITTSGGGALICKNDDSYNHVKFLATQARESFPYYQHEEIGFNYRMSNICAGIGRGQMTIANEHIQHHRKLHNLYKTLLADFKGIVIHDNYDRKIDSNFWLTAILINEKLKVKNQDKAYDNKITTAIGGAAATVHSSVEAHSDCEPNNNVEAMRVLLNDEGIESRPLWKPMHLQPVFRKAPAYVNGTSEGLFKCGLCLPSGPYVSEDDVIRIVDIIKSNIE